MLEGGAKCAGAYQQPPAHDADGRQRHEVDADHDRAAATPARARRELLLQLVPPLLGCGHRLATRALVLRVAPFEHRKGALDLVETRGRRGGRLRHGLSERHGAVRGQVGREDAYNPPRVGPLRSAFTPPSSRTVVVASLAGCQAVPGPRIAAVASPAGRIRSNVARADYAGSAACARCHAGRRGRLGPIAHAPDDARRSHGAEVRAPFDGTRWPFKDDAVVLEQHDGERFVRIEFAGGVPAEDVPRDARHRRTHARGLRRSRRRRRRGRGGPAGLVRLRDARPPLQGLLGHGPRARQPARGARVEPHVHLLPQHRPRARPSPRRARRARARTRTRESRSTAGCRADRRARTRVTDDAGFERRASAERSRGCDGTALPAGEDARAVARRAHRRRARGVRRDVARRGGDRLRGLPRRARASTRSDPRVHPSFVPVAPWLERALPAAGPAAGGQPRVRALPPGALLALPLHVGRGAARRRRPGGATSTPARDATSSSAGARARWPAPPATIPTAPTTRPPCVGWPPPRATARAPAATRQLAERRAPPRPRSPRSRRSRRVVRRLPHAAQEHGARREAHALPPHRVAHRPGARPRRPPARVRALPRRRDRAPPRRHDGGVVARALPAPAPRRALRVARRERHPRDPRARQGARAGRRHRRRSPRPARRTPAPLIAPQLGNEYPLVREWARRALDGAGRAGRAHPPHPRPPRPSTRTRRTDAAKSLRLRRVLHLGLRRCPRPTTASARSTRRSPSSSRPWRTSTDVVFRRLAPQARRDRRDDRVRQRRGAAARAAATPGARSSSRTTTS